MFGKPGAGEKSLANAEAVLFFVFGQNFAGSAAERRVLDHNLGEAVERSRKKFRGDLPRPQPSAGGSLQKALESAKPKNRENTLHRYQKDVWANSSRASQDARLRTLEAVAAAWGISLAPVSKDVVQKIAAALKMGGYRSVRQYLSHLRRLHVELTNSELSAEAELELKDAVRSVERGMGVAALTDSFELESIFPQRQGVQCAGTSHHSSWFMVFAAGD